MNTGKLCNECGKTMCENFINHGSCGDMPDWTSLAYQPDHKFFKDNITADGKISITPVTKEPFSERPDFESPRQMIIRLAEEYRGKGKLEKSTEEESSYAWGASRIWNDHVEPRDKQIAALQEEIRQLKEGMGGVVNWIQKVGVDNAIRGSVIIEMIEELMRR